MSDPNEYTMLMTSLPHLGSLFAAKRPPINRVKLTSRLKVMKPEDREILDVVVNALLWFALPLGLEDADIIQRERKALARVENETLRQIMLERLELRTCVAALRRRHQGQASPPADRSWGYGRWLDHIARNWSDPSFRLDGVFPWLREADRLMRDGDTHGLERHLLETVWTGLGRHMAEHEFDFEAVVIYVLRWHVIARWTLYNGEEASKRFAELVDSALGEHSNLLQGGTS